MVVLGTRRISSRLSLPNCLPASTRSSPRKWEKGSGRLRAASHHRGILWLPDWVGPRRIACERCCRGGDRRVGGWPVPTKACRNSATSSPRICANRAERLLVIIDDVVRLPAERSPPDISGLSNPWPAPNIIYLLIFDREIAERAFDDPGNGLGAKWHEKIVQAAPTCRPFSASTSSSFSWRASNSWRAGWSCPIRRGGEMCFMTASRHGFARRATLAVCLMRLSFHGRLLRAMSTSLILSRSNS